MINFDLDALVSRYKEFVSTEFKTEDLLSGFNKTLNEVLTLFKGTQIEGHSILFSKESVDAYRSKFVNVFNQARFQDSIDFEIEDYTSPFDLWSALQKLTESYSEKFEGVAKGDLLQIFNVVFIILSFAVPLGWLGKLGPAVKTLRLITSAMVVGRRLIKEKKKGKLSESFNDFFGKGSSIPLAFTSICDLANLSQLKFRIDK